MCMSDKKKYTAEDAWRFATNMIFSDDTFEYEWYRQYCGALTNTSFEDVMENYNTWLESRKGFHVGCEIENKDGRKGYIVRVNEKTVCVFYFNGADNEPTDCDVTTEWITECKLTGKKNDSIRRLFKGL